ncbi:animal hem peroxidase, partial [Oesophagostomum dentatum]
LLDNFVDNFLRCIRLTRALNAQQGLGFRTQINQNSHFLDLSPVYGSGECEGAAVRSFVNGSLKTFTLNREKLPPQNKKDTNCQSKDPQFCFTAGDFRNSFHPALISLHVIYIKEHNRIAAQFKARNPDWNDQKVFEVRLLVASVDHKFIEESFQEARRINIAQYQHQIYNEYLPGVLGEKLMTEFRLKPLAAGFVTDYSPSVNPSISVECIRLTRALNAQQGLGFRTQINQNSHFLDLSPVYGSGECEGASVRSFVNGSLKTFTLNGERLPPQNKKDTNCQSKDPQFCFTAGDFRNSFHPALISLHVIYIKEHNRIAAQFKASNPDWNDQKVFEEARRINIAQYQHHVYNEYLPGVLGEKLMTEFRLKPLAAGFTTDYSPSVNPSISVEFSAAAFRFGHGLVRKDFPRVTNQNTTVGNTLDLGSNIFYVDSVYTTNQGGTASFVEGLMQHAAMKADNEFSFPIRNQIFETRGKPGSGVDLVAVNIMRGRDVGLATYNEYRTIAGLKKAATFDDLKSEMDSGKVEALKRVYEDVNDIDLYTGIMLEKPLEGTAIGPTGGFIIAEQFSALKRSDRFYYENRVRGTNSLRPGELSAVRRTHLAKLVCANTHGMNSVPKDVFKLDSERVPCSSLPELDVRTFATPLGKR